MKALISNNQPERGIKTESFQAISQSRVQKWLTGHMSFIYGFIGLACLLIGWQLLATIFGGLIIATPGETFGRLFSLLAEGETWLQILITLERLLIGLSVGLLAGLVLGLLAGLNRRVGYLLEPLRWLMMTVPAVVITIMAMLWFGMGSTAVIIVAAVINIPLTYVNVKAGLASIDGQIIEMGKIYKYPRRMIFSEIYLPGISSALIASVTLTLGMGIRVVILAELMGAHEGIGQAFSRSWTYLDAPSIFAWIVLSFMLLGALEFGIIRPVKNRLMKWSVNLKP